MAFYILFFMLVLCLLLLDKESQYKNLNLQYLGFFFCFLLAAMRFDVGWDYVAYFDLIEKNHKYYDAQIARLEPFNQGLIFLSQYLNFTQLYFIVTSMIIYSSFYRTFKNYSSDFALSTLLFLSLPIFFFNSLSIIRQFVAVAIVLFAIPYIISRNWLRFTFFILLALMFHKSAIVAIPLYFLYGRKVHFYIYPILYITGFFSSSFLYLLVENILPQYLKFLDRSIGKGGDMILLLFQVLGFFLLFFINKLKLNKKNNDFYFLSFFIGLFIWSSLAKFGHAGFRGSLYFVVFILLLLPNVITEIKQKGILKEISYLVCFFFFLLTLYLGQLNPKKDPNMPYRTFILKDKSDIYRIN